MHSDIVKNCFLREYVIRDLTIGQKCFVRVSAGNMRGFGPPAIANPPYCVPSSKFKYFQRIMKNYFKTYLKLNDEIFSIKNTLGWREFSKTSRPNICDLRFEEILNKIRPEKNLNERGIIGTTLSNSFYANNGTVDGNGKYSFIKS